MPTEDCINPAEMGQWLPMVTKIHQTPNDSPQIDLAHRYMFSLAGTGFWRFYGAEIQGRYVDELPIGCRADYWQRVLDMVMTEGRPYSGVTKPNTPMGSHMAQFWIRLPMSSDGVTVDSILGFDHIAPLEAAIQPLASRQKVYA